MTTAPLRTSPAAVSPAELSRRLDDGEDLMLIDVRTPAEFRAGRFHDSVNVPLTLVTSGPQQLAERLSGRIVLVCQSGHRAGKAARALADAGVEALEVLDGGVSAHQAAGGALVGRGPRWGMERQVRMTAGSLVLVGTFAGQLIHPRLGLLAGAIGAGLTFSALSNSCAMASVLSRMPWNRVEADPTLGAVFDELPRTTTTRSAS